MIFPASSSAALTPLKLKGFFLQTGCDFWPHFEFLSHPGAFGPRKPVQRLTRNTRGKRRGRLFPMDSDMLLGPRIDSGFADVMTTAT
jgi:hypothetical protein